MVRNQLINDLFGLAVNPDDIQAELIYLKVLYLDERSTAVQII